MTTASTVTAEIIEGDCLSVMACMESASVDAVITDPPYPEINREYGRISELDWQTLMRGVVCQCRRVLKPHGSAVFVLQPNSERVGRMRTWLWEFMAWAGKEWGVVQDVYWWNISSPPTVHCRRQFGLMRPSVKMAVWLGGSDCYRNQDEVLWEESDGNRAKRLSDKCNNKLMVRPSTLYVRDRQCCSLAVERGGTTPFNILPIANSNSHDSAGIHGHGAGTPADVCNWWLRYITKPGDTVLDPFVGSGTVALEAAKMGRNAIGIDKFPAYVEVARARVGAA